MLAAMGEPGEDWAEEVAAEQDALLAAIGVAELRGVERARRDMRARLDPLDSAPVPGQHMRRPAAVAERLGLQLHHEDDDPAPRLVARAALRDPADGADEAAGDAARADVAAAEMHDAAAGGSTRCPICGAALPLQASNEAVNAHLDQCLAQNRFR
jgi:hypothetical protein